MPQNLRHHLVIAVGVSLAVASVAFGDWAEAGDAGELPGTAQSVTGGGALTKITGTALGQDVDLFRIFIDSPASFAAATSNTQFDPQLYLFTTAGIGIATDDDSGPGLNSLLSAVNAGFTTILAGEYLLAIARYDRDPFSSGGAIFSTSNNGLANGAGAASLLANWQGGSTDGGGTYQINLTGASVLVPLPPAAFAGLAGLAGVVTVGAIRRRRHG